MPTSIEFENISKQYRLGLVSTGTLSHDLNRFWQTKILRREDPYLKVGETNDRASKGNSDYVWALKDINFKVEQGDVVGIIGRNGDGKSTLLKLLSRVTAPTTGIIRAKGRIASLLEVGTGFHPEMTGRENIYMNGAIMGMTRSEITRKLDEIVDFSGCERYLDTPVKRYSSGMTVRLGFAIAAHLEPEILVVDEVLAVGDAEFQKKAIGKMQEVSKGEGRTVLFVSHNMTAIQNLCHNGVVLKNGIIEYTGAADACIDYYIQNRNLEKINTFVPDDRQRSNSGEGIKITDFKLLNRTPKTGDNVSFEIVIENEGSRSKEVEVAINFAGLNDVQFLEFNSKDYGKIFNLKLGSNKITITKNNFPLIEGDYTMNIWVGSNNNIVDWCKQCFLLHMDGGPINGIVPENRGCPVFLPCDWSCT